MSRRSRPLILRDANNLPLDFSQIDNEMRAEYSGNNIIYLAYARQGAAEGDDVWQISKFSYDGAGNIDKRTWPQDATGTPSKDYSFSYTDRATYTYA